jgi:phage FluMu protein Com
MDILFNCSECGQHMVIDEAGAGLIVKCPKCARDVCVPTATEDGPSPSTKPAVFTQEEREKTVALKWTPPPGRPDEKPKK